MYDFWNMAAVVGVFFGAMISPGPATVATASVAMSVGRAGAVRFAVGLSFGHAIWGALVIGGLWAGSQELEHVISAISVCGGLYFCWLAYLSLQSALHPEAFERSGSIGDQLVLKGIALNLLNPTVIFIWMSVLALGPAQYEASEPLIAVFVLCIIAALVSYGIVAFVFSVSGAMRAYRTLSRWVNGCAVAVYSAASVGLFAAVL